MIQSLPNLIFPRQSRFSLAVVSAIAFSATAASGFDKNIIKEQVPFLMEKYHVPGVSIAVVQGNEISWTETWGFKRAGGEDSIEDGTLFEAASMSKPLFAYAVLKLVEEDKLDLDRPLVDYLDKPYLDGQPDHRLITARMVLTHTTGFPNWREGGWSKGGPLPVEFKPGSKFGYSGEGFLYLQRVVEHITGEKLAIFMSRSLMGKIGMNASSFEFDPKRKEDYSGGHDNDGKFKTGRNFYREGNAAYSLYTTPSDYARYLIEIMKGDRSASHSLSARSIDAMLTPAVKATGRHYGWRGLGWQIHETDSGKRVSHGGSNGSGFRCYSRFYPDREAAIVIMTNSYSGETLWKKLIESVDPVPVTVAEESDPIVQLARSYLECTDSEQKKELAEKLSTLDGNEWEKVVEGLSARHHEPVKSGFYREEHFSDPALREKHPEDLLYFAVPTSYQSDTKTGLIIFMHGGGKGSLRTAPDRYMQPAGKDTPASSTRMGELFEAVGMIGVAPSAPWNENDHSRWCLPEADDYLADVVLECKERFNIDPNRVILMGHSMGGFGAYHQVQRQPDRFAAVISSAGSWTQAQWPVIRGTTFCIVHGVKDAEPKVRDRHTDIAFGRVAHKLLSEQEVPHVFLEHPGGHSFGYAKSLVENFFRSHPDLRRDPFFPHVVVASPVGYQGGRCFPVSDSRWVSLETSTDGKLEYDSLSTNGKGHSKDSPIGEWRKWELRHRRIEREGAMIEAINRGDNLIEVTTTNVSRFTVWLHPKMVDFRAPIRIEVDGKPHFNGNLDPSLLTTLESFERRKDWALVYPAKVIVEVPGVTE